MSRRSVRPRITTGAVCSVLVGTSAAAGAGMTPAQASPHAVLTMNGSSVAGQGYQGIQQQSIRLVKQADGSFGIRAWYRGTNEVLAMNGRNVTAQRYTGTQPESFRIVRQADGSFGIRSWYRGTNEVLTLNGSRFTGERYQGVQSQSFELVRQGDGSWGIRAYYPGPASAQQPRARTDGATAQQTTATTIDVTANDSGTGTAQPLDLTVTGVSAPAHGTATVQNGRIRYTPADGFTGCDTLTYTVEDLFGQKSTASVHVAVGAVNDAAPETISGTAVTVTGSGVTAAPYDAGRADQKFTVVKQGDGSVGIRNPATGTVLTMNGATVSAAPYVGSTAQSFDLRAQGDGSTGIRNTYSGSALTVAESSVTGAAYSGTQPQSLQLVSNGDGIYALLTHYGSTHVAQTPVARADGAATRHGAATTIDVTANDSATGRTDAQGLTLTAVSDPANGTAILKDGRVRYAPAKGFSGYDTFTYTVKDDFGRTATGRVDVAVSAQR